MRHLLVGAEFPPAAGGGIGTYMVRVSRLLAEAGETVHVVTLDAPGAPAQETRLGGRLHIHRVSATPMDAVDRALSASYRPWLFAKRAAARAEQVIEQHGIDIIEGSEFDAPLYVLQHRRSLGLGPGLKPPVIVHMHGASDVVFSYGAYDPGLRYNRLASRLEEFSIARADQILFPSRHYAAMGQERFAIDPMRIAVIPYPVEIGERLDRPDSTWADGSLLFAGRLEHRKGILEWLEAACILARRHPALRFEFAGTNGLATDWTPGEAVLNGLIPADLASRFIFHGHCDAAKLRLVRQGARVAVVPSRWDNLPFVCLEAMASGLPVLATTPSGAPEVVRDGVDGWIAPDCTPMDLVLAAERALALAPADLARLGETARARLLQVCDNRAILAEQMALRENLVRRASAAPSMPLGNGSEITVAHVPQPTHLSSVSNTVAAARQQQATEHAGAYLLQEPGVAAGPAFAEAAAAVLRSQPDVGIVGAWVHGGAGQPQIAPDPDIASQLLENGMDGPLLVRAAVLGQLSAVKDSDPPDLARWAAVLQAMDQGWRCVRLPEILARASPPAKRQAYTELAALQRELHSRFAGLVALHAPKLVAWSASPAAILRGEHEHTLLVHSLMARRLSRSFVAFMRIKLGQITRRALRRVAGPRALAGRVP